MEKKFDEIFGKYANIVDKFESNFTIVVYEYPIVSLMEKIAHQIELINTIQDRMRKSYLYERLNRLREYVDNMKVHNNITGVFLVGKNIFFSEFDTEWKLVVEKFDVNRYIFKYGDKFDIEFLKDYLTNDKVFNVINIAPKNYTHFHINRSKRKKIHTGVVKTNDLNDYIKNIKMDKDDKCIVHGTSGVLRNLAHTDKIIVSTKTMKDNEIIQLIETIENDKKIKQMDDWLSKLLHPELGKRIKFGKDVEKNIKNKMMKTIFCTPEMAMKINQKIPEEFMLFDMIVVRSDMLANTYGGIFGVTYY